MSKEIKIGDIVKLKSGGPSMTATYVKAGDDYCTCVWFSGDALQRGSLPKESLTKVEGE